MSKKEKQPQLHDRFMKSVLSEASQVREFLQRLLPPPLSAQLDLDTLQIERTSFLAGQLREVFSDALFRVQLKGAGKKECLVSILLEHKSYPEKYVSVQILTYLATGYYAQVHEEKVRSLRPILPFLFHHGRNRWTFRPLHGLFGSQYAGFLEYVPRFEMIYTDLSAVPVEEINATTQAWLRTTLLTQKYSHNPTALLAHFKDIFQVALASTGRNFFRELIVYYLLLTHIEPSQFKTMLKEVTTEEEYLEALAVHDSIVGEWEERGYHKGLHEGIDRARRETIQMGYANGVPLATLCLLTGYSEAQVLQIIEMNGQAGNIEN